MIYGTKIILVISLFKRSDNTRKHVNRHDNNIHMEENKPELDNGLNTS